MWRLIIAVLAISVSAPVRAQHLDWQDYQSEWNSIEAAVSAAQSAAYELDDPNNFDFLLTETAMFGDLTENASFMEVRAALWEAHSGPIAAFLNSPPIVEDEDLHEVIERVQLAARDFLLAAEPAFQIEAEIVNAETGYLEYVVADRPVILRAINDSDILYIRSRDFLRPFLSQYQIDQIGLEAEIAFLQSIVEYRRMEMAYHDGDANAVSHAAGQMREYVQRLNRLAGTGEHLATSWIQSLQSTQAIDEDLAETEAAIFHAQAVGDLFAAYIALAPRLIDMMATGLRAGSLEQFTETRLYHLDSYLEHCEDIGLAQLDAQQAAIRRIQARDQ